MRTETMQIIFTSDLHVDQRLSRETLLQFAHQIRVAQPDMFILGGDIAGGTGALTEQVFDLFQGIAPVCLTVPGNHDLWVFQGGGLRNSWEAYECYQALARERGFIPLDSDGPVRVGSIGFAGCMGWYDYSLRDHRIDHLVSFDDYRRKASAEFGIGWNDGSYITWWLTDEGMVEDQLARIRRQLDDLEADPAIREIVVINHHLPYHQLVVRQEVTSFKGRQWNVANAWMGSDRFGALYADYAKVRTVLCGHTHFHKDLWLGRVHALMNGRPGRPASIQFDLRHT